MEIDFGGVKEDITTRGEFPLDKAKEVLKGETIAVLGYGIQGGAQAQNMRETLKDSGVRVIIAELEGTQNYEKALREGWVPGETLFSLEDAVEQGTIVQFLLHDAGQKKMWPNVRERLHEGDALYFSHGFSIVFRYQTKVIPPKDIDVIMVAPKGTGGSVRKLFKEKRGINSSYAVHQDATGRALERTLAIGMAIGSGYLFPTTFKNEVLSDLTGERAVLLGELWALAEASYYALLKGQNRTPESAFIESSEQLTQVILPLIGEAGVNPIYEQARAAGELGTVKAYQDAAREAAKPIMGRLYKSVVSGEETAVVLRANSADDYKERLDAELAALDGTEMWRVGAEVRRNTSDRSYDKQITNFALAGAAIGIIEAQYEKFIEKGHPPSEAFNETSEELTQSLNPIYQDRGVAGLIGDCSTTAQRGALDWGPVFLRAHLPVFMGNEEHYENTSGFDPGHNYTVTEPNMWDIGEKLRELRPERQKQQ